MSKLKIQFFFILLFTFHLINAQIDFQNGLTITVSGPFTVDGIQIDESGDLAKTAHIKYNFVDYKKASLNDSKELYDIRYNIFSDEMEFVKNGVLYFLNKKENNIIYFPSIDKKYKVLSYDNQLHYFQLQIQGNYSFFIKEKVEYKEGKIAVTQFDKASTAKFNRLDNDYYLLRLGEELIELESSKRKFLAMFGNKSATIKKYMKRNKLSRKEVEDLIKVFGYYNTL